MAEMQENHAEEQEQQLPQSEQMNVAAEVSEEGHQVEQEHQAESKIVFRGREFASQAEATAYFEKLEDENREMERARIEAEAYSMGLRDASTRSAQPQEVEQEENFEEQFYADPKGTLSKIEERAVQKALKLAQAETGRERAWSGFASEFPDLADSREEVERILAANPYLLDMRDQDKAKRELAQKTRSYFQSIAEKFAPSRELTKRNAPAVSSGSGSAPSVTQKQNNERPLTFVEQIKRMKR